jgi:hypothetical protein
MKLLTLGLLLSAATLIAAVSISGTWDTNWGPVHLTEAGNSVTGSYEGEYPGTLQGKRSGNTVTFTWSGSNGESGKGVFTFSPDGKSFQGTWGGGDSATNGGAWSGTRGQ